MAGAGAAVARVVVAAPKPNWLAAGGAAPNVRPIPGVGVPKPNPDIITDAKERCTNINAMDRCKCALATESFASS